MKSPNAYRKQAKELRISCRKCETESLDRVSNALGDHVGSLKIVHSDCLYTIAVENGFNSWREFIIYVKNTNQPKEQEK